MSFNPKAIDTSRFQWNLIAETLSRPYPLTFSIVTPMIALVLLVPMYIFIGDLIVPARISFMPEIALDRAVPVRPAWMFVYGSLYIFVLLPLLVVRQPEQIRRTVLAYLMIWIIAYAGFLTYPTIGPRPPKVIADGFFAWGLRLLYEMDTPYNCFPSLHVAHSFVSALTCYRVHRGVGIAACVWASLIGVSTLYTKQHYIADVIAGIFLAYVAYAVFLRSYPREAIPETERRLAPVLALGFIAVHGLMVGSFWVAYLITGKP